MWKLINGTFCLIKGVFFLTKKWVFSIIGRNSERKKKSSNVTIRSPNWSAEKSKLSPEKVRWRYPHFSNENCSFFVVSKLDCNIFFCNTSLPYPLQYPLSIYCQSIWYSSRVLCVHFANEKKKQKFLGTVSSSPLPLLLSFFFYCICFEFSFLSSFYCRA